MSQENVEIVRRGFEAYNARDFPQLANLMTPDFVWDMSRVDAPTSARYAGLPELRGFVETWSESFASEDVVAEEVYDAGDQVVVIVRQAGRGRASGIEIEQRFAMVWSVHDGRASRMDMYRTPEEALKAVGLEESGDDGRSPS